MTLSVPDRAAEVTAKYREAKDAIVSLRREGGDWTSYQMMLDEAMGIAHDGLTNAWKMMDRLRILAKEAEALAAKSDNAKFTGAEEALPKTTDDNRRPVE